MKQSRGFTLIEILVTISVMVVLMAVAIVALRGTQANARDQERKFDAESIARGLEIRYNNGNPKAVQSGGMTDKGQYPGINEMVHILGSARGSDWTPQQIVGGYAPAALPGTTDASIRAPDSSAVSLDMWCVFACTNYTTTLASTMSSINTFTTTSKYNYSPVDSAGNICCCTGCVKYFLYYRTEVDGVLQTIKSKHQ